MSTAYFHSSSGVCGTQSVCQMKIILCVHGAQLKLTHLENTNKDIGDFAKLKMLLQVCVLVSFQFFWATFGRKTKCFKNSFQLLKLILVLTGFNIKVFNLPNPTLVAFIGVTSAPIQHHGLQDTGLRDGLNLIHLRSLIFNEKVNIFVQPKFNFLHSKICSKTFSFNWQIKFTNASCNLPALNS